MAIWDIINNTLGEGKDIIEKGAAIQAEKNANKPSVGVSTAFTVGSPDFESPALKKQAGPLDVLLSPKMWEVDAEKAVEKHSERVKGKAEILSQGIGLARKPFDYLADVGTDDNVYKRRTIQHLPAIISSFLGSGEKLLHTPDKQEQIDTVSLTLANKPEIQRADYQELIDTWDFDKEDLNEANLNKAFSQTSWVTVPESQYRGEERLMVTPGLKEQTKALLKNSKVLSDYDIVRAKAILHKPSETRGETEIEKSDRLIQALAEDRAIEEYKNSTPGKMLDWVTGDDNLLKEDWGLKKKGVLSQYKEAHAALDPGKTDLVRGMGAHVEMFAWNMLKMIPATGMQIVDIDAYLAKQKVQMEHPEYTKEQVDASYSESDRSKIEKEWAQTFDTMYDLTNEKVGALAQSAKQDPDSFEGVLTEKFLYPGVDGLTSMASILGITFLTKNPTLATAISSYGENSKMYIEARRADVDPLDAWTAMAGTTATSAAIEKIGVDHFFTLPAGRSVIRKIAANSLVEAGTEMAQTGLQNTMVKLTYDENQEVFEGMWESFIGAVIASGGAISIQEASGQPMPEELIRAKDTFVGQLVEIGTSKAKAEATASYAFDKGMDQRAMFDEINPLKESKPLFKTGMQGEFGERGMTQQQPSTKKPSVTDLGVTVPAKPFQDTGELSTKILSELEGKTTVSKQFISDLTRKQGITDPEKDLINNILEGFEGKKISAEDFANKVKAELLPLTASNKTKEGWGAKHHQVVLPENLKGDVEMYNEIIYESPIKTSADEKQKNLEEAVGRYESLIAKTEGYNEKQLARFKGIQKTIEKNQILQEGDIETIMNSDIGITTRNKDGSKTTKRIGSELNLVLEAVQEQNPGMSETEAFETIIDMPTSTEIRQAKKETIEPMVKTRESTKLKNKLKAIEQGIRKGKIVTRAEIKKVQNFLTTAIKGKLADDMFIDAKDKSKVKGEFLATIKNIQTPKQLLAKIKDIDARLKKSIEVKGRKNLYEKIKHELNKLKSKSGEKGKTTTEFEMLRNGMKEIYYDGSKLRTQEENAVMLSELETKLEDGTMVTSDYVTYALLSESVKGLNEMSNAELDTLLTRVQQTKKIARDSFLWKQVERAAEMEKKMEGSIKNMRGEKIDGVASSNKKTLFNSLKQFVSKADIFDRGYAQIVSLLDTIRGGKFFRDVLIQPISEANDVFTIKEDVRKESDKELLQGVFKKKGILLDRQIKKLNEQKYIGDFAATNGEKVPLHFRDYELIDLYINSKMEDNLTAMKENGIYIGGKNPDTRVIHATDEMLQAIESKMSSEAKKIADYVMKQVGNKELMNEVEKAYEAKYNKPFPFVKGGYWAMTRRYTGQTQKGGDPFHPDHVGRGVPTPKSFKERVENNNPILPTDGWGKYLNWWTDNARFATYDKTLVDIRSVIANKEFKSEFQELFGNASYSQLLDSFDWTASGGLATANKVMLEKPVQMIQSALSVVAIGAKTRNILSQGLSAPAAMAEMSIKDFTKGLTKTLVRPDKAYKKMMEIPSIAFRHKKADFTKGMFLQETARMQKQGTSIAKAAMTFTKWGDMLGVTGAGYAIYDYKYNQYLKEGVDKVKADKGAKQDASDFVNATQQSSAPEYANAIKRSNPMVRTAGVFQQSQSMYRAKGYEAMSRWMNSKNKWSKKEFVPLVRRVIAYHFTMPALYEVSRGNINPLSIVAKTAFSPISGFMGWGKVVEWGIMYSLIQALAAATDWDDELQELMPFDPSGLVGEAKEIFERTMNSVGDLIEGEGDEKDVFNLVAGTGAIFSIPVKNIKEEYAKFKDVLSGEAGFLRLLQTEWQAKQEKKKQEAEQMDLFSDLDFGDDVFEDIETEDLFADIDMDDMFADIEF